MSRIKPDGYCAWHLDSGHMPINDDGDIVIITDLERAALSYLHSDNSPAGKRLRREGWQIKPVWLSTEPPVSKEVLDDLLTAIEDFKCARTCHHNSTPEERSDTMTVYNDIIRRLESILPKEHPK